MLKSMLLIILSPITILSGIVSMAIIYAIIDKIIDYIKAINNRDDEQC